MSYDFKVIRDGDTVRLDIPEGFIPHLPPEIRISGHNVKPGETGWESIGAQVYDGQPSTIGTRPQVLSAVSGAARTVPPADPEPGLTALPTPVDVIDEAAGD